MAGKSKSGGKGAKRQHPEKSKRQWMRTYKNKEKAWARHIKKYPEDSRAKHQIDEARKNLKTSK